MCTAEAVSDSYERTRHLMALQIDEMEKIPGMVEPAGCIEERHLVHTIP